MSDTDPRHFAARDVGPMPPLGRMTQQDFERAMARVDASMIRDALNDGARPGRGYIVYAQAWVALDNLLEYVQSLEARL